VNAWQCMGGRDNSFGGGKERLKGQERRRQTRTGTETDTETETETETDTETER